MTANAFIASAQRWATLLMITVLVAPTVAWSISPTPAPPAIGARSYLLIDHNSGKILAEKNADEVIEPASITKLMTAYVVFQELASGHVKLSDMVTVSEKAWRTPGSRMFIEVGKKVSVEDLLKGMIIQSGNDASVALAEHVAGAEETFASLMNQYAQQLGMSQTTYENSTGLPGDRHRSTARDIGLLTRAIIREFPQYYGWYSERDFTFNGITQANRNKLLLRDESVDGVKTGHTDAAGYCLVSSAKRGAMRLIAVVMGTNSPKVRADASQAMLNYGFQFYESYQVYSAGERIEDWRVWKGDTETVGFGAAQDVFVTIPRGRREAVSAVRDMRRTVLAPVAEGEALGTLRVLLDEDLIFETPLIAVESVAEGNLWRRAVDQVTLWFE
ncbi:MAG: D-alanyl-D-alanine carboxypeptidase family protein [Pseudomonadota bacterium]